MHSYSVQEYHFFSNKIINYVIKNQNLLLKTDIGNKVLIGSNATIMRIKIEDSLVKGSESVVTKNCKKKNYLIIIKIYKILKTHLVYNFFYIYLNN